MSTLIDTQGLIADRWIRYEGDAARLPVGAWALLPVEEWIERSAVWRAHSRRIGILIGPADDPERLVPWLHEIELIAVDFPRFTDGRGFTLARLLRSRFGWRGNLRAVGDIIPDQVPLLVRCGFDEFVLADAKAAATAKALLARKLPTYQSDAVAASTIPLPSARAWARHAQDASKLAPHELASRELTP